MLSLQKIYNATVRIKKFIQKTPVVKDEYLSILTGKEIFLKLENLQVTHAFKIRGSANVIPLLSSVEKKRGLITASTGNHGLGFSFVSGKLGINSLVVVPKNAPETKVENIKRNGAKVIFHGESYYEASEYAHKLSEDGKLTYIHSFNDEEFFAGVATVFLELIKEIPDLDTIIGPIGGGGLIAGVSFAAKMVNPKIQVYGVQAQGAPSMYKSIKEGYPVTLKSVQTIADGVAVKQPSNLSYSYVKKYSDGIFLVSDTDIKKTIVSLLYNSKQVVEGAGAVATAALINNFNHMKAKKIAIIVSGGNIDIKLLKKLI